ncbi:ribonuclease PH [bacterium]|nr:ribonuclease PH [bacterium]
MSRLDGRAPAQMREVELLPDSFRRNDVLVKYGATQVLCYASIEDRVPPWLVGSGSAWLTAEYQMLPTASEPRQRRERLQLSGRTQEIQRLIGRSLRTALNLQGLGQLTFRIDCDVLVADGGTRTASITGSMVALANLIDDEKERFKRFPDILTHLVSAVSVGIVNGNPVCDLNYVEDRDAEVDANVVGLSTGGYAEIQATNEDGAYNRVQLNAMLDQADTALEQLFAMQRSAIRRSGWL